MAMTGDSKKADYTTLLNGLEKVVMELNDMENMIESFDESTAEPLFAKINEYIASLKEVENLAPTCRLQVPREALERLDDDTEQNPEVFAQELLTRCKDEFGQLNARLLGIKNVRETVIEGWSRGQEGNNPADGGSSSLVSNGVAGTGGSSTLHRRGGDGAGTTSSESAPQTL